MSMVTNFSDPRHQSNFKKVLRGINKCLPDLECRVDKTPKIRSMSYLQIILMKGSL